jgi:RHS repeat-associated protein
MIERGKRGSRPGGRRRGAVRIAAAVLAIGATIGSGLVGVPGFVGSASAEDELFDGLVDVPEGSDATSVDELPALPSGPVPAPELDVPAGDFSNPPLPPNAPAEEREAHEAEHGFDRETSEPIPGLTTATREVFQNEDGSQTAVVSAAPVRYRDENGQWADIELDYVEQPDGDVVADETRVPVELPAEDPASVEVTTTGGEFSISAPDVLGDAPAPADVDGSTAVVAGEAGIDAQIDMTASGFEQSVIVPSAASPSSYAVDVQLPDGVTARQAPGGVEFVNAAGQVISRFGDGVAFDSANTGWNGAETGVEVTLTAADADSATIDVAANPAWFADPARVFPVTIDPVWVGYVTATGALDTWVKTGDTTPHAGHPELRIGTVDSGATTTRSLVRIPLPPHDDTTVVADAYLSLYTSSSQSCTNTGVVVAGLSAPFDSNTVWSNQPGTVGIPAPTTTQTNKGGGASCPAARVAYDVTALAQAWMSGATQNANFRVRANNENANSDRKIFASGEGDPAQVPRLHLTYNTPPPAPTQSVPDNDSTVITTTPTLTANPVTDVDGSDVDYWFSLWTDNTPQWGGQVMSSGWLEDPSWTVPAGTLQDGGRYFRTVYVRDEDGATNQSGVRSFKVNLRLGSTGPSATQPVGPVSVNLATGNATVGVTGPSYAAVAGPVSANFAYNSQAPELTGLSGKYYNDDNANGLFDDGDPSVERTDPMVAFGWGTHSPQGGIGEDNFLVKWNGTITVPDGQGGTNYFGGVHDNGMRVKIDGNLVYDNWSGAAFVANYGGAYNLTVGTHTIEVQYRETTGDSFVGLYRKRAGVELPVPGSWLRPKDPPEGMLPQGWTFFTPLSASGPVQAVVTNDLITFRTADGGTCCAFLRSVNDDTWSPGPGSTGRLLRDDDGHLTLHAVDGTTYEFRPNGSLMSARTPRDSEAPTSWSSTYGTVAGLPRLQAITDPIGSSTRTISFTYSGQSGCPTIPDASFDDWNQVADGLLCKVSYWDGRRTYLFYKGNGPSDLLARVRNPGDEITDFAYSQGRMTSIRSALAADALAAGVRDNDDHDLDYEIAYDGSNRVSSVTSPAPLDDADRPRSTFAYNGTISTVSVDGFSPPNGYARRVVHDAAGQVTSDAGPDGQAATKAYDADGHLIRTDTPAGLRTSAVYDDYGNVTDVYGPAPASWFTGSVPSSTYAAQVPHTQNTYDEGLLGLAATWWSNVHLAGTPQLHRHGLGTTGAVDKDWGAGAPTNLGTSDYFSGRLTGWIDLPSEADWDFRFIRDGKARLYIDERLVLDDWTVGTTNIDGDQIHLTAGLHRIVVEYGDTTGAASLTLKWFQGGSWVTVPAANLTPGYGNLTRTTGPTGLVSTRDYASPHLHAQTSAVADPGGLNLSTGTAYEGVATDEFRRPISTTSPSGQTSTTTYYGPAATRDNPCTAANDPVHQGGLSKLVTSPDPDGSGSATSRVDEVVYDEAGRIVARRTGSDAWTCMSYDSRSRILEAVYPSFNGTPSRTITYNYGNVVTVNPMISSISDSIGSIVTMTDLLGRTIATQDAWGNTTTIEYDQAGRRTTSTGQGGSSTTTNTYDSLGRLSTVTLDGDTLAEVSYDSLSRITSVNYPTGANKNGNGSRLDSITYDPNTGLSTGLVWKQANGTLLTSESRTFDLNGSVVDNTIDGTDPYPSGANFGYDGVGRLTTAHVPGHDLTYGFGAVSGCSTSAAAGRASNRTSMVDNSTTTTYCYSGADVLTSTTAGGIGSSIAYDTHGNTTTLGSATLTYDIANQHLTTTAGGTTVTYVRDATGTIIERRATGEQTLRYTGGPAGVGVTTDTSGQVVERSMSLPGGATVTFGSTERWSYPNLGGSVAAIADGNGAKVGGTHTYDPYGNALNGVPDNQAGNIDVGWLGGVSTEHAANVPQLIEMGARVYSPLLGRFLEVDPQRGSGANDYDYGNADPINNSDRSGERIPIGAFGVDPIDATLCNTCDHNFDYQNNYNGVGPPPSVDSAQYAAAVQARNKRYFEAAVAYAQAVQRKWQLLVAYHERLWEKAQDAAVDYYINATANPDAADVYIYCVTGGIGCGHDSPPLDLTREACIFLFAMTMAGGAKGNFGSTSESMIYGTGSASSSLPNIAAYCGFLESGGIDPTIT